MPTVSNQAYCLPLLSSIRRRRYLKGSTLLAKHIPCDMLILVIGGKGMLCTGQEVLPIHPGRSLFFPRGTAIEVILESSLVDVYIMTVVQVAIAKRKGQWSCTNGVEPDLWPTGQIGQRYVKPLLEEIEQLHEQCRTHRGSSSERQLKFQAILEAMRKARQESDGKDKGNSGIEQSIVFMHKHFHSKIKLETLSGIAGLTPTSYSRSFKKAKGISPLEYVNRLRIHSSKQLLQQPEVTIKDVSAALGFSNEFYFSRLFKNTVGISPVLFMKRRQLRVAAASCFRYQDCLRSLGVSAPFEWNAYQLMGADEEERSRMLQAQLEALQGYRPELIIADSRHSPFYERLKQIAPTVIVDLAYDWRSHYMRLAELVGREEEARRTIGQLELKASYARKILAHTMREVPVSLMRLYNGRIRVQGMVDHPVSHLLYTELGLQPGSCVPLHERNREYSLESLPPLDSGYLFVYKHSLQAEEAEQAMSALEGYPIRSVPNWVRMSWSPGGQHQIIDELLEWRA
ncbi:AraC family transcriptional regulator [Paenibacillus sp. GD4]|uniref:helix-turn-helix domain-containing protein n=1 Tax=Paenibacillus sp. GD4 TaxID=3068890 RepID=UPI002796CADB|nr:helix-turn-helix domain-containing protein [Paenibacillus sp. GD4]MDQ1911410.1 AraC family transcriptional regulator [Paenibacillus sp. GD4]